MSVLTPNMSLIESTVGVDSGLLWEQNLNASLDILDGHNHSPGSGIPITPDGMNINADLPFNDNSAITLKSVQFSPQVAVLTDLGSMYEVGVDLYYTDGLGNNIRITQNGSVTGASGSITGLTPPASVSYVSLSKTFIFQSDVNTPANLDAGSIILRDILANSFGITLSPPASLAADYTITYPAGAPLSRSVQSVSAAGASVWQKSYDAIVGSSSQVTAGSATHSTLTAAIGAVSAQGRILVLQGAWTENISINKTLYIEGSGTNSVFTGNLGFVGVNYGSLKGIRWSGSLSLDSSSNGNEIDQCYMAAGQSATDSGNGNFVNAIFQG